ncbi:hypothetical protein AcetOrient_orf02922 [Acetobacter orientalis]|uniref:Uncharacterized protein n=1 Tax=Acetobacter orientalis TaxID=146474 RepID=A0A2Z5ZIJ9_9PROT|nr:hypothetical protein AcetOrient_orf02922 [Acetobacter orientalis]
MCAPSSVSAFSYACLVRKLFFKSVSSFLNIAQFLFIVHNAVMFFLLCLYFDNV